MRRRGGVVAGLVVAAGCAFVGIPLLMVMVLMGGTADIAELCAPGSDTVVLAEGASSGQLDQAQLANASAIISEGSRMAVPRRRWWSPWRWRIRSPVSGCTPTTEPGRTCAPTR